MAKYLLNSWSWNMARPKKVLVSKEEVTRDEFDRQKDDAISCMGHPGLARVLNVPYNTEYIKLNVGDEALVVSTENGKLPYNALELPAGLSLKFDHVKILQGL